MVVLLLEWLIQERLYRIKTQRTTFLLGGSSAQRRLMNIISIPIYKKKKIIGILSLYDFFIVSNLDRRLFSVISFLNMGNNSVPFDKYNIQLEILNGPMIKIHITTLQSYAVVLDIAESTMGIRKTRISTYIVWSYSNHYCIWSMERWWGGLMYWVYSYII